MNGGSEESFWSLIGLTNRAMRSYADKRLQRYDLTIEQMLVLKHLDVSEGMSQNGLSQLADKSPANITRILDRLENKNNIIRRPNPDDRRSSLVFLTGEGENVRDEVIGLFMGLRSELVEGIPADKQQIAVEVLKGIKLNIEKMINKRSERG
ncbi:MAG: MarR family winged helix-turn-helix transcriptional regulator [Desulforhopalus sp.]